MILSRMKIHARSDLATARVEMNVAGSIQHLLAAMHQFQTNPDVKSVNATLVQP